jgi:hypothetical protein
VLLPVAELIENTEVQAWLDMYDAVPEAFQQRFHPEIIRIGNVVLTRCRAMPFIHFNSVLNLGLGAPATERQLEQIVACYRDIPRFMVLHNPHCQPPGLPEWMETRGLRAMGAWERVYRTNGPLKVPRPDVAGVVEIINQSTAGEWAAFLDSLYGTSPHLGSAVWLEGADGHTRRSGGTERLWLSAACLLVRTDGHG